MTEHRSPGQGVRFSPAFSTSGAARNLPERGSAPDGLAAIGIREFCQTVLPPYRIFYRVIDTTIVILPIADGRRDMRSLEERVLRGNDGKDDAIGLARRKRRCWNSQRLYRR